MLCISSEAGRLNNGALCLCLSCSATVLRKDVRELDGESAPKADAALKAGKNIKTTTRALDKKKQHLISFSVALGRHAMKQD